MYFHQFSACSAGVNGMLSALVVAEGKRMPTVIRQASILDVATSAVHSIGAFIGRSEATIVLSSRFTGGKHGFLLHFKQRFDSMCRKK